MRRKPGERRRGESAEVDDVTGLSFAAGEGGSTGVDGKEPERDEWGEEEGGGGDGAEADGGVGGGDGAV